MAKNIKSNELRLTFRWIPVFDEHGHEVPGQTSKVWQIEYVIQADGLQATRPLVITITDEQEIALDAMKDSAIDQAKAHEGIT